MEPLQNQLQKSNVLHGVFFPFSASSHSPLHSSSSSFFFFLLNPLRQSQESQCATITTFTYFQLLSVVSYHISSTWHQHGALQWRAQYGIQSAPHYVMLGKYERVKKKEKRRKQNKKKHHKKERRGEGGANQGRSGQNEKWEWEMTKMWRRNM